jgi:hypothetical protein
LWWPGGLRGRRRAPSGVPFRRRALEIRAEGGGIRWRREVPGDAGQSPRPATCPVRAVWQSCYPNLKLGFECVNSDLNQTQMGSGLSNCVIEGCLYWS